MTSRRGYPEARSRDRRREGGVIRWRDIGPVFCFLDGGSTDAWCECGWHHFMAVLGTADFAWRLMKESARDHLKRCPL